MEKTEIRLSGGTKLLLELVKLKRKDSEDVLLLFNALSPDVWNFSEDCGWEECAYTALTFLKGGMVVNLSLANLDLSKLKKVIKSVIEKVWKDASLKKSISAEPNGQKATTSQSEPADRLIGNEIQERMTSARGRASRKMSTATTLASIPEPYELGKRHIQRFKFPSTSYQSYTFNSPQMQQMQSRTGTMLLSWTKSKKWPRFMKTTMWVPRRRIIFPQN